MTEKIKWMATFTLIVGSAFTGFNVYPLGPMIQVFGGLLWLIASVMMKDKPLMVTNSVMMFVGLGSLILNQLKVFG